MDFVTVDVCEVVVVDDDVEVDDEDDAIVEADE